MWHLLSRVVLYQEQGGMQLQQCNHEILTYNWKPKQKPRRVEMPAFVRPPTLNQPQSPWGPIDAGKELQGPVQLPTLCGGLVEVHGIKDQNIGN